VLQRGPRYTRAAWLRLTCRDLLIRSIHTRDERQPLHARAVSDRARFKHVALAFRWTVLAGDGAIRVLHGVPVRDVFVCGNHLRYAGKLPNGVEGRCESSAVWAL
jgi:hypothetical protein